MLLSQLGKYNLPVACWLHKYLFIKTVIKTVVILSKVIKKVKTMFAIFEGFFKIFITNM